MGESSSLCLLGPALVERNGQAVRGLASGKALALLAYLIVYGQPSARGQPVSREHLADLFWRHLPPDRGRANLSWLLHHLSTLAPDLRLAQGQGLQGVRNHGATAGPPGITHQGRSRMLVGGLQQQPALVFVGWRRHHHVGNAEGVAEVEAAGMGGAIGPHLAGTVHGFRWREQQQAMAGRVADALDGKAIRKEVSISLGEGEKAPVMHLLMYIPAKAKQPVPAFTVTSILPPPTGQTATVIEWTLGTLAPGDSVTAIVIGVLLMKNVKPGPEIFEKQAALVWSIYLVFFLANLLLIPVGLYQRVGGYPDIPLMEDVALVRSLPRLVGLPVVAMTGAERYLKQGWMRRGARAWNGRGCSSFSARARTPTPFA